MRKLLTVLMVGTLCSSCIKHTEYGECIGVQDKAQMKKEYRLSYWNIFIGLIFSETIIVPVVVALDDVYCPTGENK